MVEIHSANMLYIDWKLSSRKLHLEHVELWNYEIRYVS